MAKSLERELDNFVLDPKTNKLASSYQKYETTIKNVRDALAGSRNIVVNDLVAQIKKIPSANVQIFSSKNVRNDMNTNQIAFLDRINTSVDSYYDHKPLDQLKVVLYSVLLKKYKNDGSDDNKWMYVADAYAGLLPYFYQLFLWFDLPALREIYAYVKTKSITKYKRLNNLHIDNEKTSLSQLMKKIINDLPNLKTIFPTNLSTSDSQVLETLNRYVTNLADLLTRVTEKCDERTINTVTADLTAMVEEIPLLHNSPVLGDLKEKVSRLLTQSQALLLSYSQKCRDVTDRTTRQEADALALVAIQQQLEASQTGSTQLQQQIDTLQQQLQDATDQLTIATNQRQELENQLTQVRNNQGSQNRINELEQQLQAANARIQQLDLSVRTFQELQDTNKLLQEKVEDLEFNDLALQRDNNNLTQQIQSIRDSLNQILRNAGDDDPDSYDMNTIMDKVTQINAALTNETAKLNDLIDAKETEIRDINALLEKGSVNRDFQDFLIDQLDKEEQTPDIRALKQQIENASSQDLPFLGRQMADELTQKYRTLVASSQELNDLKAKILEIGRLGEIESTNPQEILAEIEKITKSLENLVMLAVGEIFGVSEMSQGDLTPEEKEDLTKKIQEIVKSCKECDEKLKRAADAIRLSNDFQQMTNDITSVSGEDLIRKVIEFVNTHGNTNIDISAVLKTCQLSTSAPAAGTTISTSSAGTVLPRTPQYYLTAFSGSDQSNLLDIAILIDRYLNMVQSDPELFARFETVAKSVAISPIFQDLVTMFVTQGINANLAFIYTMFLFVHDILKSQGVEINL